jgi:hypothetical protein
VRMEFWRPLERDSRLIPFSTIPYICPEEDLNLHTIAGTRP